MATEPSFGDDLKTLPTDQTSEVGNMDLLSMLFNKVLSNDAPKENFRQTSDNQGEKTTNNAEKPKAENNAMSKLKSILNDLKKAILLTLLFLGIRTEIFRNALAKVSNKPIITEVITVSLFVLITLVMLRFV
jgi:hypothetical protein